MADLFAPLDWAGRRLRARTFPFAPPPVPTTVEPPEKTSHTGLDFETEWARSSAAQAGRRAVRWTIIRPVIGAYAAPKVKGGDRLASLKRTSAGASGRGNAIFVANHHSHADVALVLSGLPTPWRDELVVAAAADYFFTNRVSSTMSAFALNAIPIERSRVNRRSGDTAAALIEQGWSLLIFPEGGRSPDGWGQEFRAGAAYLAIRTNTPLVPLHIAGSDHIWPKGQRYPVRGKAKITIGAPIHPSAAADSSGNSSRRRSRSSTAASRDLTELLERRVAELADESETDWWQARQRAHQGDTPTRDGPVDVGWRRAWAKEKQGGATPRSWP